MKDKLISYCIDRFATIYEALKKINHNARGFLIVIDDMDKVIGTLTDGDIRRALLDGKSTEDNISGEWNSTFEQVYLKEKFSKIIDAFKNHAINFLPIVNEEGQLVNLITKKQMHSVLLQDIHVDLTYDFMILDEDLIDYEIFQRPWGFYKTTLMNEYFHSKVISINPESSLSLQSHNHREEHWIVAHGRGIVQISDSRIEIRCGSSLFIPKGCKHRVINTDEEESLIIVEVQIGDYFGEEDIIRYEDDYGRK